MIGLSLSSVSTHNCVYWRTTTTTTQSLYDRILCLLTEDNDNPIIIRPHSRPSVNTICGRIMIGLSLSSVSKHNMWSYYDYHILCLLMEDNDNPIIIRPYIVFRDRPFNLKGGLWFFGLWWWRRRLLPGHMFSPRVLRLSLNWSNRPPLA
jgi:hypothetical protein